MIPGTQPSHQFEESGSVVLDLCARGTHGEVVLARVTHARANLYHTMRIEELLSPQFLVHVLGERKKKYGLRPLYSEFNVFTYTQRYPEYLEAVNGSVELAHLGTQGPSPGADYEYRKRCSKLRSIRQAGRPPKRAMTSSG